LPGAGEQQGPEDVRVRSEGIPKGAVLHVEDEDALRVAVSKRSANEGFRDGSGDGCRAIDLFRNDTGSSSLEVIAEARRIRPDIKIILTSAYNREMVLSRDAPQSMGFIRKPFQLDEVVQLLRETLVA
jgi:DNA-binding NtrC family response regulator